SHLHEPRLALYLLGLRALPGERADGEDGAEVRAAADRTAPPRPEGVRALRRGAPGDPGDRLEGPGRRPGACPGRGPRPPPPAAPAEQAKEDLSPESQRQIPILEAIQAKGSGPTEVPFGLNFDYYAAADGTTLAVITVETPREAAHGAGDEVLRPFARLAPQG